MLSALPMDAVRLVHHFLHEDTGPTSYNNLRTSLLSSHSLSNYQKMERMMRLPPLGDRKPSVMLGQMLEFCPAGESFPLAPAAGDSRSSLRGRPGGYAGYCRQG